LCEFNVVIGNGWLRHTAADAYNLYRMSAVECLPAPFEWLLMYQVLVNPEIVVSKTVLTDENKI